MIIALASSCDAHVQPARPDAGSFGDVELRRGCPSWTEPLAQPGDAIGGDTWETFAAGVFEAYCTRCHSSELTGNVPRSGAPTGLNWDDPLVVREHLPEIRRAVGVLNYMPPFDPKPGCWTRRRLVRWIDAGAP